MWAKYIGFIGGGRITAILVAAMQRYGMSIDGLVVSDPDETVRTELAARFPGLRVTSDNLEPAGKLKVFLALHPPAVRRVLPAVAPALHKDAIIVSLAPMLPFAALRELAGGHDRLVRMIPNAPSMVNAGYNPVAFAPAVPAEARACLNAVFDVFGRHPEVDEDKLEAYAILTAMGPTYMWFQWQTLRELGASFGLSGAETDEGLAAMIHGGAQLLLESGLPFAAVEDTVAVKPLAEAVQQIQGLYTHKLTALFKKLKAQ